MRTWIEIARENRGSSSAPFGGIGHGRDGGGWGERSGAWRDIPVVFCCGNMRRQFKQIHYISIMERSISYLPNLISISYYAAFVLFSHFPPRTLPLEPLRSSTTVVPPTAARLTTAMMDYGHALVSVRIPHRRHDLSISSHPPTDVNPLSVVIYRRLGKLGASSRLELAPAQAQSGIPRHRPAEDLPRHRPKLSSAWGTRAGI